MLDKYGLDFFSSTQQENEYRVNRVSGYLSIGVQFCALLAFVLDFLNVFILDSNKLLILFLLLLPFTALSFVIATVLQIRKSWVKYLIVIEEAVVLTIIFTFLSMHVALFFMLPLVKSCLYFNRRVCLVAGVSNFVALFVAHVLSVPFSIVFDDPLIVSYESALLYGFFARAMEFVFLCVVVAILNQRVYGAISDGYLNVRKIEALMDDQSKTHYEIVKNLATISENKSNENGEHIARVFEYMKALALHMGYGEEESYDIGLAAMLHDVGKLAVDERILSKPARLTEEEFAQVKKHVGFGKQLLSNSTNRVLKLASVIAEQHHERWDGRGYLGLKGEEIDCISRLMSVVDVFDALTSKRCYKPAWPVDTAYNEIVNGRGTQFAPEAVDAFVDCFPQILTIYHQIRPADEMEEA